MELHIQSEFDCTYSINGEFFERADSVTMNEYDVVYITVFPLSLSLLPYTVKLCGGQKVESPLASGVRLSQEHYLLALSPRYITVYRGAVKPIPPKSTVARLFARLSEDDADGAYALLSPSLRAEIDKKALKDFFAGFTRLIECPWEKGNKFYLIDKNGAAHLHSYALENELISDINECD